MQQSIIIKKNKNRKNLQNLKNWIICVPILINKNGPSIGVFSIEANTNNDSNTQRVISLINGARNNNKDSLDKLNKLESDLNSTFWKTILKLDLLKEEKYAKQVAIDALSQLKNSV